jgi:anti-sigma regulatory factor (Ser/Thr protein kinase)
MPRQPRPPLAAATTWITAAASEHGDRLFDHVMERLAVSRRRARKLVQALVDAQWLEASGTPRKRRFTPGTMRQVVRHYALDGLQEDLPWAREFAPLLSLQPNVARLAQHAFTELLNNAIDHSGGSGVTVSVRQTGMHLQMLVSDDGCGVFQSIERGWQIDDPAHAMLELSKGKLTTQPDRHCGHGLFFVARAADIFDLHANRSGFQRRPGKSGWFALRPLERQGTSVFLAIALDTQRTLDEVLRAQAESGYGFEHTEVALRLLTGPGIGLESRAQARRVALRLAQFRRARLDFSGVEDIGPAFADELFRVFARANPGVELRPEAMAPRVAAMVNGIASVN